MTFLLPDVAAGGAVLVAWPWLPALGLGLALRADGVTAGAAVAVAAGALLNIWTLRRDRRRGGRGRPLGRVFVLAAATLAAAAADDLAILWCSLEVAALAAAALLSEDGGAPHRSSAALAAFAVAEAGGLALFAAALLVADISGSFRLGDAWRSSAELRAHPLWLPMAGLALGAAATRLAPCFLRSHARGAWAARGAAIVASVVLALRLGPALGITRASLAVLAALGAGAGGLVAWRSRRGSRLAPPAEAAAERPSLLVEIARAARLLWQPLAAPPLSLSLASLAAGAALAVALGVSSARPGAWPELMSAVWRTVAGSGWLLLAVGAGLTHDLSRRTAQALGWTAAGAALLLVASAPAAIAGAEIVAGLPALWLLARALALPLPALRVRVLLGASLAGVAVIRLLVAGAGAAPGLRVVAEQAGLAALAPLALPLGAAAALLGLKRVAAGVRRALAGLALIANLALAAALLVLADRGAPLSVALGIGPAPFGIHLLLDRLAAGMLLVAAMLALLGFLHDLANPSVPRSRHPDAIVQLQLLGIAGSVLAADLLELVLFFGILLLAWHPQLPATGDGSQPAAARHVAVVGATGTAVLLVAVGCLGGTLGTLGYAELALRVPQFAVGDAPLLRIGAYLLVIVLALRAAALPFGWWLLPAVAAAPTMAVTTLVLVALTGVYALLRLYVLVFPCFGAGPCGPSGLVLPFGLTTLAAGGIAALAATTIRGLTAPLLLITVGTLLVGVGSFRVAGFAAAIYLLVPTALAAAALAVGAEGRRHRVFGLVSLWAALGLPPFPGWIGRIALLGATAADALVVWTLVLTSALLAAIAAARVAASAAGSREPSSSAGHLAAPGAALVLLVAFTLAAGPAFDLATRTARQLFDRQATVAAFAAAAAATSSR